MTRLSPITDLSLARWSGLALVAGGFLSAISSLIHPLGETSTYVSSPLWVPAETIAYVALLLVLPGLIGLYALYWERLGRWGLVGIAMVFVGGSTVDGEVLTTSAVVRPYLAAHAPALNDLLLSYGPVLLAEGLGLVLFLAGYLILEIAVVRAAVLPRWVLWLVVIIVAAIPLAVGTAVTYTLGIWGFVLLSLSFVGWGYALLSRPKNTRS